MIMKQKTLEQGDLEGYNRRKQLVVFTGEWRRIFWTPRDFTWLRYFDRKTWKESRGSWAVEMLAANGFFLWTSLGCCRKN